MGRSFNLSELLLPHLYIWDNLVNFPGTLEGINAITFERSPAHSAWHIDDFNMCQFPSCLPSRTWDPTSVRESWFHKVVSDTAALLSFLQSYLKEPGVFGDNLSPVSSVSWQETRSPMGAMARRTDLCLT